MRTYTGGLVLPAVFGAANGNDCCQFGGNPRGSLYHRKNCLINVMIVDLRGRITLGPETEAVRSKLKELLNAGHHRIILNLGEVTISIAWG